MPRLFDSPKRVLVPNQENHQRSQKVDRRRAFLLSDDDEDPNENSPQVNRTFEASRSFNRSKTRKSPRRQKLKYDSFCEMDVSAEMDVTSEKPGDIEGDTLTSLPTRTLRSSKTGNTSEGFALSESDDDNNDKSVRSNTSNSKNTYEETRTIEKAPSDIIHEASSSHTGELVIDEKTRVIETRKSLRKSKKPTTEVVTRKKTPTAKKSFAMQFDLTNKTPTCKSFGMQFNADNRTVADTPQKSFALTESNVEETEDKEDDQMIELTLPSPEKSRKKGAKVAEKRKSETYVKKTEKTVDETEINFNPKPKPKTSQKKKDKKVVHQAENFTVANPVQLVEDAGDEYEDFAFDLVALFEVEPIMIPPKWSTDQNFLAAANHIQDCMKEKFQSKADELLEQRKAKGKQVTTDDVKQVIGQFGELKRLKQYALLLNKIERPPVESEFGQVRESCKERIKYKLQQIKDSAK